MINLVETRLVLFMGHIMTLLCCYNSLLSIEKMGFSGLAWNSALPQKGPPFGAWMEKLAAGVDSIIDAYEGAVAEIEVHQSHPIPPERPTVGGFIDPLDGMG